MMNILKKYKWPLLATTGILAISVVMYMKTKPKKGHTNVEGGDDNDKMEEGGGGGGSGWKALGLLVQSASTARPMLTNHIRLNINSVPCAVKFFRNGGLLVQSLALYLSGSGGGDGGENGPIVSHTTKDQVGTEPNTWYPFSTIPMSGGWLLRMSDPSTNGANAQFVVFHPQTKEEYNSYTLNYTDPQSNALTATIAGSPDYHKAMQTVRSSQQQQQQQLNQQQPNQPPTTAPSSSQQEHNIHSVHVPQQQQQSSTSSAMAVQQYTQPSQQQQQQQQQQQHPQQQQQQQQFDSRPKDTRNTSTRGMAPAPSRADPLPPGQTFPRAVQP